MRLAIVLAALLLSDLSLAQEAGMRKKCEVAIHDTAAIEDAIENYGCELKSMGTGTADYYKTIKDYSSSFCMSNGLNELPEKARFSRVDNKRLYELTLEFQGEQKVKNVFCVGFSSYTLRWFYFK